MITLLVAALTITIVPAQVTAAPRAALTRPAAELFGTQPGFGITGSGVNTATGNYTIAATDLALSGTGTGWSRTYNSLNDDAGPLGPGWTTAYQARLDAGEDGAVRLRHDDGRVLTFVPDGAGYRRPQNFDADLARAADGTATIRFQNGARWSFDASGRGSGRSADGLQLTFEYADDRLTRVTESTGRRLDLTYAGDRLESVTGSDGRAVTYTYADGRLATVTRPGGDVIRYSTDGDRITAVRGADGGTVTTEYDADGRVRGQELADGDSFTIAYDEAGGTATVTDPVTEERAVYTHSAAGLLTRAAVPDGGSVTQEFDDQGRLTGGATTGGTRVALGYDARGNLTSSTLAGSRTAYTYDGEDRVTSVTTPAGVTRYGRKHHPVRL